MNGFPLNFFFNFADEPGCVSFSHSPESTHKVVVFWYNVDFMRHFLLLSNKLELHVLESMLHCFEFFFTFRHLHFLPVSSLLSSFTL